MTTLAAHAQPVILISVLKPIAMTAILFGWARVVLFLNSDLHTIGGQYRRWNAAQTLAGACAFGVWLVMPDFLIGLPAMALICGTGIVSYTYYRNQRVSPEARWSWHKLLTFQGLNPLIPTWLKSPMPVWVARPDGVAMPAPTAQDTNAWVNRVFERLMGYAITKQAQRVVIQANANETQLFLQIDGIAYPQPPIHPTTAAQIMNYVKHHARIDPAEKRRRLTGRMWINADSKKRALVVTTMGTMRGLELVIEIDPQLAANPDLNTLGMLPDQQRQLEQALTQEHGVALVSCPPGHGQTTVLYGLVKQHDPYTQSVLTLEDRIATEIEGICHSHIQTVPGSPPFLSQAESLIRQEPHVLMLTDAFDHQVAKLLADTARGARVYLGMRQPDTFTALRHWAQQVGDLPKAIEPLRVIVAGHLVRRLCHTCRVPYQPPADVLKKLNLSAAGAGHFYKDAAHNNTKPCPDCNGIGYKGRVGVFEVMTFDDETKRLILSDQLEPLRLYLRKHNMVWLSEAAMTLIVDGTTTISEITRVLSPTPATNAQPPAKGGSA